MSIFNLFSETLYRNYVLGTRVCVISKNNNCDVYLVRTYVKTVI